MTTLPPGSCSPLLEGLPLLTAPAPGDRGTRAGLLRGLCDPPGYGGTRSWVERKSCTSQLSTNDGLHPCGVRGEHDVHKCVAANCGLTWTER